LKYIEIRYIEAVRSGTLYGVAGIAYLLHNGSASAYFRRA